MQDLTVEQLERGLRNATKAGDMQAAARFKATLGRVKAGQPQFPQPEPDTLDQIADVFTGELRTTEEIKDLPTIGDIPELNELSWASFKSGLGTMMTGPEETAQVIKSNFPEAKVRQDEKGNYIITSSIDGKDYAIKPGFTVSDIPKAAAGLLSLTPIGAARTIAGKAGAGAASAGTTQAAFEASQAVTGGEFNPEDVATAAALGGGAGAILGTGAKALGNRTPSAQPTQALDTPKPNLSDIEQQRLAQAEELGFTDDAALTTGQITRDTGIAKRESELAKLEPGEQLRERYNNQNAKILQTIDSFIDNTGATNRDVRAIGESVDTALQKELEKAKNQVNALYKEADKAGEMSEPVSMKPLADYLNAERSGIFDSPSVTKLQTKLEQMGVVSGKLREGDIDIGDVTLKQAEDIRKFINKYTSDNDPLDIRISGQMKSAIDSATEDVGGNLYKRARRARVQQAKDFENVGLVKNLINTKRGSDDRAIAFEDVLNKSLLSPSSSIDNIKHLKGLLNRSPEGKAAWKDLQGGFVQELKKSLVPNSATNQRGDAVVSAASFDRMIKKLDDKGRMNAIMGKTDADKIRALNEVVKVLRTAPPGTINTSNTASAIAVILDGIGIAGGMPAPVASILRFARDKTQDTKLKVEITKLLKGEKS